MSRVLCPNCFEDMQFIDDVECGDQLYQCPNCGLEERY